MFAVCLVLLLTWDMIVNFVCLLTQRLLGHWEATCNWIVLMDLAPLGQLEFAWLDLLLGILWRIINVVINISSQFIWPTYVVVMVVVE